MTEEPIEPWRARYLQDRFTPEERRQLAWLSDDVLKLAYKAISPTDQIPAPPDDNGEEWIQWEGMARDVMRENVPALNALSDVELNLAFAAVIGIEQTDGWRAQIKSLVPHPLESVVWAAFAENDCQDGSSLAQFLAGARVRGGQAYRVVALDVLAYMTDQGLLEREEPPGWWRKKVTPSPHGPYPRTLTPTAEAGIEGDKP